MLADQDEPAQQLGRPIRQMRPGQFRSGYGTYDLVGLRDCVPTAGSGHSKV